MLTSGAGLEISPALAVVPVLVGPLQTLLALLPGLLVALGGLVWALFKPRTAVKALRLIWMQKLPAAGLACTVGAAWWGLPKMLSARQGTAETGGGDSPVYRGGIDRRGWQPGHADPTAGGRIWSYAPKGAQTVYAAPAVCGKYVYSTTVNYGPLSDQGSIVCLDSETGREIWRDGAGDLRSVFSSPALSGEYLVCGEGLHYIKDARVVCLDRRSGRQLWSFRTQEHVESSPCIYEGKVYIGAGSNGYYCLKLEGDGAGEPVVLWHKTQAEGFIDCESSPVAFEGRVYAGLGLGGEALCCLDAESGQELWRLRTEAPVFTPPAIAAGCVFFGMGNGDFVHTAEQLGKPAEGRLCCVDLQTKKVRWSFSTGGTVLTAPVVANGKVYAGSVDGWLYCLAAEDGKLMAKWNAQAPIGTSPAVAQSCVYFVTAAGILYALDAESLAPRWEIALWTKPPRKEDLFFSSPTVANGHVYVGSARDGLLCLGEPGKPSEKVWSGYLGGPGKSGRCDEVPMAKACEVAWSYPQAGGEQPFQFSAPPAYLDGTLFLPLQTGQGAELRLVRVDPLAPAHEPVLEGAVACALPIAVSPAARRGSVYFVEGKAGQAGRRLRAVDVKTGAELWAAPVERGASGEFALAGGMLLAASLEGGVAAYGLDGADAGKLLWKNSLGAAVGMPMATDGRVIVALTGLPRLALLDDGNGAVLWMKELAAEPTCGPVLLDETVCVGTAAGVWAYRVLDGAVLWSQPEAGATAAPLVVGGGLLAAVNGEGRVNLLDAQTGKLLKSIGGAPVGLAAQLGKDALFYFGSQGYLSTTLDSAAIRVVRLKLSAQTGKPVTPALVLGGHLLFGTTRGLLCAKPKER